MTSNLKDVIIRIKTSYDIVDYMRSAGLKLQPNGTGRWKTNCPFHKEKTPSFIVNETHQYYKCFGCGASGDLLTFVQEYENLQFMDAVTKMAEGKNIPIDIEGSSEDSVDYRTLYKILKHSANFYYGQFKQLDKSHPAWKEIIDRGLSLNGDMVYGYAPAGNALYKELLKTGFSEENIILSGVCRKSDDGKVYDFFRRRLMFIITDRYNKPIGFSSRKLFEDDTRGKYVNSVDSPLFHKSKVLYNHYLARLSAGKEKTLYICEGQFDVASFVEAGMKNVVASSGTSFTDGHMNECRKLVSGGELVFCFDGDSAGVKAAESIFLNFPEEHSESYVVMFPDGVDPCDYRLENGNEALVEKVGERVPLVEFMLRRAKEQYDLKSLVERSKFVEHGARIISSITNLTIRESCMRFLSLESMTPLNDVREAVSNAKPLVQVEEKIGSAGSDNETDVLDELGEPAETVVVEMDDNSTIVEKLRERSEVDLFYYYAVRFINLGLMEESWRKSLLNVYRDGKLPKFFNQFFEDLEKVYLNEHIIPEQFTNPLLAEFLMGDDYSPFYKFMSKIELRDHFIYLHDRLLATKEERRRERFNERVLELLNDELEDVGYMAELLDRMNENEQ